MELFGSRGHGRGGGGGSWLARGLGASRPGAVCGGTGEGLRLEGALAELLRFTTVRLEHWGRSEPRGAGRDRRARP